MRRLMVRDTKLADSRVMVKKIKEKNKESADPLSSQTRPDKIGPRLFSELTGGNGPSTRDYLP